MIDAAGEAAARSAPAPGRAAESPSWPALGRLLLADIAGAVRERLHLAALEGQQFVHATGRLLAFGVAAAVLALTAWFVVVAAIVIALARVGLPLPIALVVGAALNLLAAAWAWAAMRRQLSSMTFAATLRSLQPAAARDAQTSSTPPPDPADAGSNAFNPFPPPSAQRAGPDASSR